MQPVKQWTMLTNTRATAQRYFKGVVGRSPLGQPLQTWYRRRRAIRELCSWTPSDETARRFYAQFVGPGDLCFDVGANRGNRTKVFWRLGARVVAVEPQSSCVEVLRGAYKNDPQVTIVQAACSSAHGRAMLRVCDLDVLSSLSDEWIEAVSDSGRFAKGGWTKEESCELVTLDQLIEDYGTPAFAKIDVEGFELNVLEGLSRPLRALSFEFTPERFATTMQCADYLCGLGVSQFNVVWGESFQLFLDAWVSRDELLAVLSKYREDRVIFGDVYARQPNTEAAARTGM